MALITVFMRVAVVVMAIRDLMALAALSALGVSSVYQIYLRAGSKMQLNPRPAMADMMDHFKT